MVQILPQFDPGAQAGQALGSGISDALKLLGQRQLQMGALDQLKKDIGGYYNETVNPQTGQRTNELKANVDPLSMLIDVYKGTAGIPGLAQSFTESVAPLLLNRTRSLAALSPSIAASGSQYPTQQGVQPSATDILNQLQPQQRPQAEVQGQNLAQVPRIETQAPAFKIPDRNQFMATYGRSIIEAGGSVQDAENAYQNVVKYGELEYNARAEAQKQQLDQQQAARQRESETTGFLKNESARWQNSHGLGSGEGKEFRPDQFYESIAYNSFDDLRKKNPEWTDQKVWQEAKKTLDNFHEGEARLSKVTPFSAIFNPRHKEQNRTAYDTGKTAAHNLIKLSGDTPEIRERLVTDLMDSGWEEDYARSMVNSPSKELNAWFNRVKSIPIAPFGQRPKPGELPSIHAVNRDLTGKGVEDLIAQSGLPNISPTDDIILLRNRLYRDKLWPKKTVDDLILRLDKEGKLSPYQQSQLPEIARDALVIDEAGPQKRYLFEIFQEALGDGSPAQSPWEMSK